MLQYIVFLGAIAELVGVYHYIKETLRGETKPNKVTWLMWTVAPFIGTAASLVSGAGWSALPVFMAGFGPLLVLIASFANPKAYWKLEKFDYACGILSVLALIGWLITKDPLIAIAFSIASDGLAATPTIIKCWKQADTESVGPYSLGIFNALTSFFVIKAFTLSETAFPIYLVFINSTLTIAFYAGKMKNTILAKGN